MSVDFAVVCSFHTDPSGTFVTYEAKAIGSGSEGAQSTLQVSEHDVSSPVPSGDILGSAECCLLLVICCMHLLKRLQAWLA